MSTGEIDIDEIVNKLLVGDSIYAAELSSIVIADVFTTEQIDRDWWHRIPLANQKAIVNAVNGGMMVGMIMGFHGMSPTESDVWNKGRTMPVAMEVLAKLIQILKNEKEVEH